MQEGSYPHYEDHKAEHNELLDSYTEFIFRCREECDGEGVAEVADHLRTWIISHILSTDKKMSAMLAADKAG